MLQELLDGILLFYALGSIVLFLLAGIVYLAQRPRRKRRREKYLREMGRLKD